jgi:hypothetical protein
MAKATVSFICVAIFEVMKNNIGIEEVLIHKFVFSDKFLQNDPSCFELPSTHALHERIKTSDLPFFFEEP